ncbi:MAG: GTPase HflX [Acidilobus sp.]
MGEEGLRRALLVIAKEYEAHEQEALAIAESAGYEVVKVLKRSKKGRRLSDYMVRRIAEEAGRLNADVIIYYGNLEPSSIYRLEKESRKRVLDRVMVILEIFALHAGSREAKLQIEMAKLKHELPLVREYVRRAKLGEQVDFLGPGRYAFEAYERHITSRIARIRRELEELRRNVALQEAARKEMGMVLVGIVGYASAGKTSLFNALTGESQRVGPEYFTTLHPKHKSVDYDGLKVTFVDTVGFVMDVPPEIIESFYSTLQEAALSDLLIFVVDSSEPLDTVRSKVLSGVQLLGKLNALGKPMIFALNKIDLVSSDVVSKVEGLVRSLASGASDSISVVPVSAKYRINLDALSSEVLRLVRLRVLGEALREGLRAQAGTQAGKG